MSRNDNSLKWGLLVLHNRCERYQESLGPAMYTLASCFAHPVHQQGKVFGWQVLGLIASSVRDSGE